MPIINPRLFYAFALLALISGQSASPAARADCAPANDVSNRPSVDESSHFENAHGGASVVGRCMTGISTANGAETTEQI